MTFEDCFSRLTDPRRDGAGWRAVCPSCGGRNLTLRANPANGEPWLHCYNCDASMGELFRAFGEAPTQPRRRLLRAITDPLDEAKRIAKAREMWKASLPAQNTLVQTYLEQYRAIPS